MWVAMMSHLGLGSKRGVGDAKACLGFVCFSVVVVCVRAHAWASMLGAGALVAEWSIYLGGLEPWQSLISHLQLLCFLYLCLPPTLLPLSLPLFCSHPMFFSWGFAPLLHCMPHLTHPGDNSTSPSLQAPSVLVSAGCSHCLYLCLLSCGFSLFCFSKTSLKSGPRLF